MNRFVAKVKEIETHSSLNLISLEYKVVELTMNTLELPEFIKKGSLLEIGVKPSHIAIASNISGEISFSNRIETNIESIERGELLSSVVCRSNDLFEVIITTKSVDRMKLQKDQKVELLIKASELFITRFLDD